MIKIYSIDRDYLEKFLNMIPSDSINNILVNPDGIYSVICNHDPTYAGIYYYAYKILTEDIKPIDERVHESSNITVFDASSVRKLVRTYDMGIMMPVQNQEIFVSCIQKLLPDSTCSFLSSSKFVVSKVLV